MLEKTLDENIRTAIENGEFDNLKGAGKPLDLDEYFAAPADVRVGYARSRTMISFRVRLN